MARNMARDVWTWGHGVPRVRFVAHKSDVEGHELFGNSESISEWPGANWFAMNLSITIAPKKNIYYRTTRTQSPSLDELMTLPGISTAASIAGNSATGPLGDPSISSGVLGGIQSECNCAFSGPFSSPIPTPTLDFRKCQCLQNFQ